MSSENLIGEYLRARRELVLPEDAGLPKPDPRRRVPGLRRAEVAMLAGVSPEYYMRLEQGRDRHPSPQVLDALARALQLDQDAAAHLHRLAQPQARRRPRRPRPERVPADIAGLIDAWDTTPAYIQGRHTDVLAANALATALAPFYAVGTNLLRAAFLDPRVQDMHPGWEHTTGKITKFPIVLVGSGYWNGLLGWLKETMLAEGNIGPEELELFHVADDPAEILKIIKTAHAGMSHK